MEKTNDKDWVVLRQVLLSVRQILVRVTGYSVDVRYPEERAAARTRYTKSYCETELGIIEEIAKWLKSEMTAER